MLQSNSWLSQFMPDGQFIGVPSARQIPICSILHSVVQWGYLIWGWVMKYVKQVLIILAFTLAGELLAKAIPLPIPVAIYGFILLFIALCTGLLKPSAIDKTADFLIGLMPLLFVAPAVGILEYFDLLAPQILSFVTIVAASTFVTFAVAGMVTQLLRKGGAEHD